MIEWNGWALDATVTSQRETGGPLIGRHTVVFASERPFAPASDLVEFERTRAMRAGSAAPGIEEQKAEP